MEKTILEIWLLVEKEYNEWIEKGGWGNLCSLFFDLHQNDLINTAEYGYLIEIIHEYAAIRNFSTNDLFWNLFDVKPRRMFIQKQILKAIKNEKQG